MSNGTAVQEEQISPELVLVDPELADAERAKLADRPTTPAARPARPAIVSAPPLAERARATRPPAAERLGSRRLLIGVAAATVATVLFFDVRVEVGDIPASATRGARQAAAVPPHPASKRRLAKPKHTPTGKPARVGTRPRSRGSRASKAAAASPRRFAWAPTPRASGYYVEFFRGPRRVFARETSDAAIEIPVKWRYNGVERSFMPGEYRWYVWPVINGRRVTRAAVQTMVSIP